MLAFVRDITLVSITSTENADYLVSDLHTPGSTVLFLMHIMYGRLDDTMQRLDLISGGTVRAYGTAPARAELVKLEAKPEMTPTGWRCKLSDCIDWNPEVHTVVTDGKEFWAYVITTPTLCRIDYSIYPAISNEDNREQIREQIKDMMNASRWTS